MSEIKTQYESLYDEVKQNDEICKKYNLYFLDAGYISTSKSDVCNVIKKLEIDIYNLKELQNLSNELIESYKKSDAILRNQLNLISEEYQKIKILIDKF